MAAATPLGDPGLDTSRFAYLKPKDVARLAEAYRFSEAAHAGQKRQSGHPYISHPLAVAEILADWHLDGQTLMAALLHDVTEDTKVTKDEISDTFGKPVAELVDGVSKLDKIEFQPASEAIGLGSASGWWDSHGEGDAPEDPVIDAADGRLEPAWEAFSGTHLLIWNAAGVQREAEDALDDIAASIAHVPEGAYVDKAAIAKLLGAADRLDSLAVGHSELDQDGLNEFSDRTFPELMAAAIAGEDRLDYLVANGIIREKYFTRAEDKADSAAVA